MKIAIDEGVKIDKNGHYLINVGYLRVSTDKQAEENYGLDIQEDAEKVREIFRLFIKAKMPPQKIADSLEFKGDRQIRDILTRKSLTGCIVHLGQEYKCRHEAIIPKAYVQDISQLSFAIISYIILSVNIKGHSPANGAARR